MAFDIEGARKAGYSDGEIADFLGKESGFDVAGAAKAGYTPAEIVGHLSASRSTPKLQVDAKPAGAPAASTATRTEPVYDPVSGAQIGTTEVEDVPVAKGGAVADELANLRDSFFTGVDNTRASVKTVNMGMVASGLDKTSKRLAELEARGEGNSRTARLMRDEIASYKEKFPAVIGEMTEAQGDAQRGAALSTRPAVAKVNAAKTFGEAWEAFKEAPYDVIAGVTATSLPSTLPALAAAAVMGPGAGAVAMGASSAAVEGGSSLAEFARDAGVDVTNGKAVEAFFTNPENLSAAMAYAGKRAGIIGTLDAVSGGVAGKTIAPAMKSKIARQAVNLPTQMATQASLGAGGEALGQLATKGEIDQPGQVLMEAAGELGGAPMEVAAFSKEARDAMRGRAPAGAAPAAAPRVDPIADIVNAPTVDQAIVAAQSAVQSSTAVDNIAEILKQNQPVAQTVPASLAIENIAQVAEPESANVIQTPTQAEAVAPAAPDQVPAGAPAGDASQPAGPGALLETVRAEPATGALDQRLVPLSQRKNAAQNIPEIIPATTNVQDAAPRATAQTQATPAETPEARADAGVQPAATGTTAGAGGVQAAGVVGERLDKDWTAFAPDTGTLSVPRAEMPQIKAEHRGAMVNFLNARDIAHTQEEVPAASLKPTQTEFSPAKVAKAMGFTGTDRSILVSSDNHVLDGHHQWMAKLEAGEPVKVIRLDAPIKQLLEAVREFPSAEQAAGTTAAAPQPSARQVAIEAEKARIEAKRVERKAARAESAKAPEGLSVGMMPNSAEPVTVKDGVVYVGKYAAQNFETGDDVTVPAGASDDQIRKALLDSGALGKKARIFGASNQAPAQSLPAQAATVSIATDAAAQRADFAASEKARKVPGNAARTRANEANPFKAFLGKHGISNSLANEFAPGRKERQAAMVQGYGPMFRKSGPQLDALAQRAVEEGFLLEADETKLHALILDALRGKRIIPQYAAGVAEDEMQARMDAAEEFARQLPDDVLEALDADIPGSDTPSNTSTEDAMRALGFTDQEIQDATASQSQSQGQGSESRGRTDETAKTAAQSRGEEGNAAPRDDAEGLTSPTPADVLAQQQRAADGTKAEAKATAAADNKAKADAEVNEFTLTGSERAADADPNQKPMFSRAAQATEALDAAGVTGKERLDVLKDVKAGTLTPEEVQAAYPAKGAQTDTPAFKKWFGDSVVTNTGKLGGKPLPMYHGTSASEDGDAFKVFDTYASNYGLMGMGGYFTADPAVASSYTAKGRGESPSVYKVFLSIKNPIDMEAKADVAAWEKQFDDIEQYHEGGDTNEAWYRAAENMLADQDMPSYEGAEIMQDGLRTMGFDGITHMGGNRVKKDGPRHRVYIAFDPEQIKSATGNNGDFDGANPNIQFSRAATPGPVPALEAFKTKSGATAFKTPEIALADPRLNVRQPGGDVKRIDYEIRDRKLYAEAMADGATPAEARDEASVGIVTLDVDAAGVFKSLRNIEIYQSKRGNAIAEKVVGGIVESLPAGAKLHIHDILPTATGFWDKMGASFPRSEDFMEANLSPQQFRNAYDTRKSTPGTRGQPQESRAATDAGAGSGRSGPDGAPAQRSAGRQVRNPSTVERVQAAVAELIGGKQLPNKLGRVVATTASEIKSYWEPQIGLNVQLSADEKAGAAQAFYDPRTKTVFLIADHIPAGDEQAVAAHELMHKHGQTVLGAEGWDKLHTTINGWANAEEGSDERAVYTYARSRVEAVGTELSSQEMFPYAVEAAIKMGVKPSLIAKNGTVARWLGSVKYAMQQAWGKVTGRPETFKTQDLVDLAFGIAQMENPESAAAMGRITDAPLKTDSPEFERWFGDSVATVDGKAGSEPLVVYHGAPDARFVTEDGTFKSLKARYGAEDPDGGAHWFAGSKRTAATYADDRRAFDYQNAEPGVIAAYLKLENPLIVDGGGKHWREAQKIGKTGRIIEEAKAGGHDGIIVRNVKDDYNNVAGGSRATDTYVVFRSNQIKSATENTTFDPANPDIRFSRAPAPGAKLSPWRDATGRLQFAPGAWLYDKIGAAAGPTLVKLGLKAASPELRRQLRQMKIDVEKAQETAGAIAKETMKLSEAERAMVSDLVEQELKVGIIPPAHAVKLAAMINDAMGRQTDELVALDMLTKDSADKWRGKYLPRYYESKLSAKVGDAWADAMKRLTGRQSVMKGIKGKNLKGRGLYETIPEAELANYEALGWEVRDPDYTPSLPSVDGTVQVWRDFSPEEREKMGEIRDAGFRFVMGYMQTGRDIAVGRMFERMAADPEQSSRLEKEGYVQVPTTTVSGTGAKVYGKLAGRWVPTETMSQLSNIEESTSAAWQMYRQAMAIWKMGKTSMNPVSHVNNMVSNLTMAHLAGVSYHRGDKYLAAARDFIKKPAMMVEAKENGLFLGTLSDTELMNTLPEELKILAQKQESKGEKVARTGFDIMTMFLRKPMGAAYQAEDTFFRYLIYKYAREHGMEPQDAVDYAQKYIFTYDDLPKGARRIRDFGIPFFSYTYKAAPALLHTALTHPVRMAAPAAVLWGINAAAYAIATGDDDDSWQETLKRYLTDPEFRAKAREKEKLEREHLPPWNKGTTSMMTPKMIRLGMDEITKLPLFIDVSRIIPGGDLFDVSPNAGGVPLPQPITPSHPLFTTMVAMLGNKDMFLGKEITDSNDTTGEKASKRSAWLWKQLTPAITAGNYHWERGMNALAQANGGEVKWVPDVLGGDATGIGKDGNPVQPKYAAMQTFGIKVRPVDLETAEAIEGSMKRKMIRDIDGEIKKLQRLASKGAISDRTLEKERDKAIQKKENLRNGLTVDGSEKD